MLYKDLATDLGITVYPGWDVLREEINVKKFRDVILNYDSLIDLNDQQNNAPTFTQFIDIAKDDDIFMIYIVTDDRPDKRVTIEGIITNHKDVKRKLCDISTPDEKDNVNNQWSLWWD